MKKNLLNLFAALLLIACSSDNGGDGPSDVLGTQKATLSTTAATEIKGRSITTGGNITNGGDSDINFRGVCWSLNSNPSIDGDSYEQADGSGTGSFSVTITNLEPNTAYYIRAFAQNDAGVAYGENIHVTTTDLLQFTSDIPRNIITTRVDLKTVIEETDETIYERGFVINTSPTPTIDHLKIEVGFGSGEYGGQLSNLNPNTTYYMRPYGQTSFGYIYGEEQSFKTTGYYGPSGSFVIFDKGELTDGWRYLEAAPTTSSFNSKWGCTGTFISNTYPEVGKGLENTNIILANCGDSNCAARKCDSYSYGGYNDWFLPSNDETIIAIRSLSDLNALPDSNEIWTSTQVTGSNAYAQSMGSDDNIYQYSEGKGYTFTVIPIRRY